MATIRVSEQVLELIVNLSKKCRPDFEIPSIKDAIENPKSIENVLQYINDTYDYIYDGYDNLDINQNDSFPNQLSKKTNETEKFRGKREQDTLPSEYEENGMDNQVMESNDALTKLQLLETELIESWKNYDMQYPKILRQKLLNAMDTLKLERDLKQRYLDKLSQAKKKIDIYNGHFDRFIRIIRVENIQKYRIIEELNHERKATKLLKEKNSLQASTIQACQTYIQSLQEGNSSLDEQLRLLTSKFHDLSASVDYVRNLQSGEVTKSRAETSKLRQKYAMLRLSKQNIRNMNESLHTAYMADAYQSKQNIEISPLKVSNPKSKSGLSLVNPNTSMPSICANKSSWEDQGTPRHISDGNITPSRKRETNQLLVDIIHQNQVVNERRIRRSSISSRLGTSPRVSNISAKSSVADPMHKSRDVVILEMYSPNTPRNNSFFNPSQPASRAGSPRPQTAGTTTVRFVPGDVVDNKQALSASKSANFDIDMNHIIKKVFRKSESMRHNVWTEERLRSLAS